MSAHMSKAEGAKLGIVISRFSIRHTFPNGQRIGAGLVTSGNTTPPPVATYTKAEAETLAASMRRHNPGHTFDVVPA